MTTNLLLPTNFFSEFILGLYTVSNATSQAIAVGDFTLNPGESKKVDFLTKEMLAAIAGGYLNVTPNDSSVGTTLPATLAALVALTNSTTGTPGAAVVDVGSSFSQATLDNNFATLTVTINNIIALLNAAGITPTLISSLRTEANKNFSLGHLV